LVDLVKDCGLEPDVGVVLLPSGQPICSNIYFARAMDRDEEDLCLIAHRPDIPSYAV
jgi:hypothetical protein